MRDSKKPDSILFIAGGTPDISSILLAISSLTLIILGILILASVSAVYSMEKFGNPTYLLYHQLIYGFLPGLILGTIAFFVPLEKLKKAASWFFCLNLVVLGVLLFSKLGLNLIGASRWLNLGLFTFQPAEILKLSLILYLAALFAKKESPFGSEAKKEKTGGSRKKAKPSLFGFVQPLPPFTVILGIVTILLVLQPNIGTLGIIALIATTMFFLAGTPLWQNLLIWISGAGMLAFLIKIAPYRLSRWLVFLNPDFDPMGKGYQLKQSLIAIGSGGIFGLGLGLSRQKFGFLPQTIGDAIFPVFAEEAGFLGSLILILVFLIFVFQGLKISFRSNNDFSRFAGAGISFWIGVQALINIYSMTGLLPLTGVPLPFISYGGSHLVSELIGLGLLLNISKKVS